MSFGTFFLTLLIALSGMGQDAPKPDAKATDKKSEVVKKLTSSELSEVQKLNQDVQAAFQGLQAALETSKEVADDNGAKALGYKIALLYGKAQSAQDALNKKVGSLLTKYDCDKCSINNDGTLVPQAASK